MPTKNATIQSDIVEVIQQYWGFDQLRPLQQEAIRAGVEQRDSLVVLPTGGGKSLCYQVPPIVMDRTDIVVSPLISLMKDQIDGLKACGYPAVGLYSGMSAEAMRDAQSQISSGAAKLIFAAPERLLTSGFLRTIQGVKIRALAIDEAHCISHWGHDFRPEYRQLALLKDRFPGASLHAYTATATERVRADIIEQLRLKDPTVLVGDFDRPNLTYRVVPRVDLDEQVFQVVQRHKGEAVIVYCISRKDTEEMAAELRRRKVNAKHYHAGMETNERRETQEEFAEEKLDVVVATVAFGMGIDRSDVRCVIHAAMPKSIEHYQQETGRAGRDGLEAECVLLYSAADRMRWDSLISRNAQEAEDPAAFAASVLELMQHMQSFCVGGRCRHKTLKEYFGQAYEKDTCGACDVCLNEVEGVEDATVTAQKIISCVARVQERFGAGHVVDVLRGANTERVLANRHQELSTYGLMKTVDKKSLTNMVYQLLDQGLLSRSGDEYPVLALNGSSWEVLRGQRQVNLIKPKASAPSRTKVEEKSWEGVDKGLFEALRTWRRELAQKRGVPAFVILGDAPLREMSARRPSTREGLLMIRGIGQRKLDELGTELLSIIETYCQEQGISVDTEGQQPEESDDAPVRGPRITKSHRRAFDLFAEGKTLEQVMTAMGRARTTTQQYLADYITENKPASIDRWIEPGIYKLIADVAEKTGTERLKPIFEGLNGKIPYDVIRIVVRHLQSQSG